MNIYRKLCIALICLLPIVTAAQTTTSLGFKEPVVGSLSWGKHMNSNFTLLNAYLNGTLVLPSLQVNALSGAYTVPASKLTGILTANQLPAIPWAKLTDIPGAFPPIVHSATYHDSTVEAVSRKGVVNGYAGLDSGGKVPYAQLPGLTAVVATVDLPLQSADISATTVYSVPVSKGGMYRFNCSHVITRAASVDSTTPVCRVAWTDLETNVVITSPSSGSQVGANNTVGTTKIGSIFPMNVKDGTNIQVLTTGYTSSGATTMQFSVHVKIEYLGN
jgi:hypothetical protein